MSIILKKSKIRSTNHIDILECGVNQLDEFHNEERKRLIVKKTFMFMKPVKPITCIDG